ncbi:MAG: dinitrogenase iron-molybdenum cofactor biosynthesis protein [Epsilonproteobacteria bacterium]|nr:dinitrogenase iron-molybdenum cofactor biosynthesis protein [Campylobacterota bacterium]
MRIVIPTHDNNGLDSKMGAHFGKANYYTIVDVQDDTISDIQSVENKGHSGGCSNAVANILSLQPDVLIVVGIGPNPAMGFYKANLPVFVDQQSTNVKQSIEKLLNNQLPRVMMQGTCKSK